MAKATITLTENITDGCLDMDCEVSPPIQEDSPVPEAALYAICITRLIRSGAIESLIPVVCKDLILEEDLED